MPYERPGAGVYVIASKITRHNDPAVENGLVGVAVKQVAVSATAPLAGQQDIPVGERFHIRTKGIRQFPTATGTKAAATAAGTKGQGVYIRPADNTLHLAGATAIGDLPYGRIVELPADGRGVPTGHVRIDLDMKDTLALV